MSTRKRVTVGNSHLTIYPWTHPATGRKKWRFAFRDDGRWKYRTFRVKADAEAAATRILEQTSEGLAWEGLDIEARKFLEEVHRRTSPTDRPAVLAFLRSRDTSAEIGAAVAAYLDHKRREAGEETPHLRTVGKFLDRLSTDFKGQRVSEIHAPELATWWTSRGADRSAKSQRDYRAHLVTFWRWALRQGIAGADPVTAADRLPNVRVDRAEPRILSVTETCSILNAVRKEWRAWAVLGAFAGMRPEEISPKSQKLRTKRGLQAEEIDFQFRCIRVPACVSKTNRARIIPFNAALEAGLAWAGITATSTGPICRRYPGTAGELRRIGKLLFAGDWPDDALRHSYGSYRNAILRNLDQVAEEMGNSVAMLHAHYHNPQPEATGHQYFTASPCSDSDPTEARWTFEHSEDSNESNPENTHKPVECSIG
jgi:hypothetical protein